MPRDNWSAHLAEKHLLMLKTVPSANLAKVAASAVNHCMLFDCDTWSVPARLAPRRQTAECRTFAICRVVRAVNIDRHAHSHVEELRDGLNASPSSFCAQYLICPSCLHDDTKSAAQQLHS